MDLPEDHPARSSWRLVTDYQFTRRKQFHYVIDPSDEVRFRHRLFFRCLAYLREEGVEAYWTMPADQTPGIPLAILLRTQEHS